MSDPLGFDEALEQALALRLDLLSVGDVEDRAVEPEWFTLGPEHRLPLLVHPPHFPTGCHDAVLEDVRLSLAHALVDRARDIVAVLEMNDARVAAHLVDEVRGRVARDLRDFVADELHRPVGVVGAAIDRAGDVRDERAKPPLAFAQGLGGHSPVGDVDEIALDVERISIRIAH